jgi:hypothetical protein
MKNIQYYLGAVVLILVTGCQYELRLAIWTEPYTTGVRRTRSL